MVEIGGRPILWHLMQHYSAHGFREFVLALGYKGEVIKQYFLEFFSLGNDLTIDLQTGSRVIHKRDIPDWHIDLVDTGVHTMTGGRLKRVREWLGGTTFMATYGDGLSDVDIRKVVEFHRAHGKLATVTAVRPPSRFGGLAFDGDRVVQFLEKPQVGEGWINGGFFVLEPKALDYVDDDSTSWERAPLERLAQDGQLMAFRHDGFFQPMDTIRDRNLLQELWESGRAPWKVSTPIQRRA